MKLQYDKNMDMTSWQDRLAAFRDANPDLPEGPDVQEDDAAAASAEKQNGRLTASIERKGRAGKTVTRISGFTVSDDMIARLASEMKRSLGTGGAVESDGSIIIQGDRRDQAVAWLVRAGYKARKA